MTACGHWSSFVEYIAVKKMPQPEMHLSTQIDTSVFSQIPSQMIVRHFETRGGWKFTDYLNTDLSGPTKGSKLGMKTKTKSQEKRGRIKKKTKIHLLRLEPRNPRARQVHDQRTVGQRQSVSACGCCFNFVEYIAVKKRMY